MSGGSFDYNCFKVQDFADELRHKINATKDQGNDSYCGYDFKEDTLEALETCHGIISAAAKLAHHVEWLYSGDWGEELFLERWGEVMREFAGIQEEG